MATTCAASSSDTCTCARLPSPCACAQWACAGAWQARSAGSDTATPASRALPPLPPPAAVRSAARCSTTSPRARAGPASTLQSAPGRLQRQQERQSRLLAQRRVARSLPGPLVGRAALEVPAAALRPPRTAGTFAAQRWCRRTPSAGKPSTRPTWFTIPTKLGRCARRSPPTSTRRRCRTRCAPARSERLWRRQRAGMAGWWGGGRAAPGAALWAGQAAARTQACVLTRVGWEGGVTRRRDPYFFSDAFPIKPKVEDPCLFSQVRLPHQRRRPSGPNSLPAAQPPSHHYRRPLCPPCCRLWGMPTSATPNAPWFGTRCLHSADGTSGCT